MFSTLFRIATEYLLSSMASSSVSDSSGSNGTLNTLFNFKPFKILKVEAIGNQVRDINCPTPRSGHRIIVAGGNVYSFGGYTPITIGEIVEHILFKELWIYNCASRTWRHLKTSGTAPDELASHCAAYVDNHLLIFGGTAYPFGEKSSNDAHICSLKTLQWSKLETSGSPPIKQYGQAMTVHKDQMYVVGGTTGYAYSNTVHCFNLSTKEWTYLESNSNNNNSYEPDCRYRHEIAVEDNKIYVFGGGTSTDSFDLKDLPVFNLETRLWEKVTTTGVCPAPRRCHSCVQLGSDVYVCGGLDGINSFSDIFKIDLKTLIWEELSVSLPTPLYFHASALSDSYQLFIFGGVNGEENQRSNELYTMWLKIPSLATICWQAVLHYVPHVAQIEKEKLFEAGVPIRFLNEVEFYPPGLQKASYNSSFVESSSSSVRPFSN